ncbi:MAG: hypothetical protein R3236_12100, partial [Phycisphaeraceae bacterium]|nr:hypothetical protein [Phycisphaeraceae bacterium]
DLLAEASADVDLSASTGRVRRRRRLSSAEDVEQDDVASALDELAGVIDGADEDEPVDLDEQIPLTEEKKPAPPEDPSSKTGQRKRPKSPIDPTLVDTGSFKKQRKSSRPKNPEESGSQTLGQTDLGSKRGDEVDAFSEPDQ